MLRGFILNDEIIFILSYLLLSFLQCICITFVRDSKDNNKYEFTDNRKRKVPVAAAVRSLTGDTSGVGLDGGGENGI